MLAYVRLYEQRVYAYLNVELLRNAGSVYDQVKISYGTEVFSICTNKSI